MAITYPTTLDVLVNPTATDQVASVTVPHATQHANANDILEALEAKVGVTSSAVTTSHDYKLGNVTGSDKAASVTGSETLTNKTLTAAKIANGGFIADANGNELIEGTTTASATNHINTTNAATGNDPLIDAKGSDTNISLKIKAKGTGKVKLGSADLQIPNTDGTVGQVLQTDGTGVLSFAAISTLPVYTVLAGENLTAKDTVFVAEGSETRRISAFSTTRTVNEPVSNTQWVYQSFTTSANTTSINRVKLWVGSSGNSPTLGGTVRLRATPNGADIASTTFGWGSQNSNAETTANFANTAVSPSTTYFLVISAQFENFVSWFVYGGTTSTYSGGVSGISINSGVSWTTPSTIVTGDFYFEVLEGDYTTGRVYKTIASTTFNQGSGLTANFIGFNQNTVTTGNSATIQVGGVVSGLTGLTTGLTYYLSNTAGATSSSAGTTSKKIGLSVSTTEILIKNEN